MDSHHLHPRDGYGHGHLVRRLLRDLVRNPQGGRDRNVDRPRAQPCLLERAAPHPMAPWPLGIGKHAAVTGVTAFLPAEPIRGCVIAGQSAVWQLGREQPARAGAELLPVGGDARVPGDDLSCQVKTFPAPAWLRGNPSVHAPSRRPWKCSAPRRSPRRSTCTSAYDHRLHRVDLSQQLG